MIFQHLFWWFEVHTGTVNESGPFYGFWSGFGSDIGEVTLIAAVIATFRHRNCSVKGCWRLGKNVDGTPHLACHKHHPAHGAPTRNISLQQLHDAHRDRIIR